jgi:predicted component of type VI protein secretion system
MAGAKQRAHSVFKVKAEGRTRLVVFDTQDLSLGRSAECDLALDDPEMSRKHAIFRRTPEGCRVEDQGTSNGTGVNGEPVAYADLEHGDVIRIGEVEISYAETTRNPASLGSKVEYASQLKSFHSPLAGQQADGEATILGVIDGLGSDFDEPFEVRPAGEFDFGLHDEPAGEPARDLDAELADLGADLELDLDLGESTTAAAPTRLAAGPESAAPAKPAPPREQPAPAEEAWVLDDPIEEPAKTGPLSITLEIDGVEGDLRRQIESWIGKVVQLPGMRVRVKGRDLG